MNGSVSLMEHIWENWELIDRPWGDRATIPRPLFRTFFYDGFAEAFIDEALNYDNYNYDFITWVCEHMEDKKCILETMLYFWVMSNKDFEFYLSLLEKYDITLQMLDRHFEGVYSTLAYSCIEMTKWYFANIPQDEALGTAYYVLCETLWAITMCKDFDAVLDYLCDEFSSIDILSISYESPYKDICEALLFQKNKSLMIKMHNWGVPRELGIEHLHGCVRMANNMTMAQMEEIHTWIDSEFKLPICP